MHAWIRDKWGDSIQSPTYSHITLGVVDLYFSIHVSDSLYLIASANLYWIVLVPNQSKWWSRCFLGFTLHNRHLIVVAGYHNTQVTWPGQCGPVWSACDQRVPREKVTQLASPVQSRTGFVRATPGTAGLPWAWATLEEKIWFNNAPHGFLITVEDMCRHGPHAGLGWDLYGHRPRSNPIARPVKSCSNPSLG